jgi:hypothetical protein
MSAIDHVVDDNISSLDSWFLIFWLIWWTIGGIAAIVILLWLVGGKETVGIDNGEMTIGKRYLGWVTIRLTKSPTLSI